MEGKRQSELREQLERASQAAQEAAKTVGKAGLEAAALGAKHAARYVKDHPKRTAIGMAVALAATQEGHEWQREDASFVEQSVTARVMSDEWLVDVRKVASVVVGEEHGTFYALFKMILEDDPAFGEATEDQKAHVIDAMIAAARELNPQDNLDDFDSLKGRRLLLPTEFLWRPRESRLLSKEGYATLQDYAQRDGFALREKSHQAVYKSARSDTEAAQTQGSGFTVKGEDMEARLVPDVMTSIEDLGRSFSTLELGPNGEGWQLVVTDMLRDEAMQRRRGSLKSGSSHSTGRSFDVSDGRFVKPDGKEVTWSMFDEHGRAHGRGPDADIVIRCCAPRLKLALESGWVLYKGPGHWHVYVPKAVDVDVSDEWARYAEPPSSARAKEKPRAERGEISQNIGDRLLDDYAESVRRRASFAELEPERDEVRRTLGGGTFIHELETHGPNEGRIVDQVLRAQPQDLGRLGYFEHTTIHNAQRTLSDIEDVWRWKTREKLFTTMYQFGHYVEERVGPDDNTYDFAQWYEDARELHDELNAQAKTLFARKGGLTEEEAQALVNAITPEVMLSTIHAEFLSQLPGGAFVDVMPRLFDGYNIMQGPALNDHYFSSGPVQLIYPTFELMLARYGSRVHALQKDEGTFSSVVVPKKVGGLLPTKDVAEAMVLDRESVAFWSYMSMVYHTEAAFHTLMQNHSFARSWKRAGEADRLRFMATFVPVANHIGRGGAANRANGLLSKHDGKSLRDLAYAVQNLRMKSSAVRSARVGLESMEAMIARAQE